MTPFEEDEEAWPDEPDEFDPHSLGPEVPSVDTTEELVEAGQKAPKEVHNAFWAAVIFANIGLLGVSLGAMLLYFRGNLRFGGGAFLVGVVGLLMTYRRYHAFMNRERDESEPEDADAEPAGDD